LISTFPISSESNSWSQKGFSNDKYQYSHIAGGFLISYFSATYLESIDDEYAAEKGLGISIAAGITKEYIDKNYLACDPFIPKCVEAKGKLSKEDIISDTVGALLGYGIYKMIGSNPLQVRW